MFLSKQKSERHVSTTSTPTSGSPGNVAELGGRAILCYITHVIFEVHVNDAALTKSIESCFVDKTSKNLYDVAQAHVFAMKVSHRLMFTSKQ
jgi:hypothetical protein